MTDARSIVEPMELNFETYREYGLRYADNTPTTIFGTCCYAEWRFHIHKDHPLTRETADSMIASFSRCIMREVTS